MSLKRGKLSKQDETFILQNVHELSAEDIGAAINRTPATIEKFIKKKNLKHTKDATVSDDEYERNVLLKRLRDRNYYPELTGMLTTSELARFEEDWVEVILQFRDDVMYTEEITIKQWIIFQVLADRCMKSRKSAIIKEEECAREIEQENRLGDDRDTEKIQGLTVDLNLARDSQIAFTREHSQIMDKLKDIERSLKATRDARVKRIEDSKTSWLGYLRMLEEEKKHLDAGEDAEIKRLAKDAAKERLSKWHKFEDGAVDQPLLTPDTVLGEFDEQKNQTGQGD